MQPPCFQVRLICGLTDAATSPLTSCTKLRLGFPGDHMLSPSFCFLVPSLSLVQTELCLLIVIYQSPNPQDLSMDCVWRQGLCRGHQIKTRQLERALIHSDCRPYTKRRVWGNLHAEGQPHEEAARMRPSAEQGERPQRSQPCPHLDLWTSSLQNCEKRNFCCESHPVCGI